MSDLPSLLDLAASYAAADTAVQTVHTHADASWMKAALTVIRWTAYTHQTFTTDEVWDGLWEILVPAPHEPRAMGAALRQAVADGIIIATADYRPSARVAAHARPCRVWKSLVYLGEPFE